jgi:hypothetical protein
VERKAGLKWATKARKMRWATGGEEDAWIARRGRTRRHDGHQTRPAAASIGRAARSLQGRPDDGANSRCSAATDRLAGDAREAALTLGMAVRSVCGTALGT